MKIPNRILKLFFAFLLLNISSIAYPKTLEDAQSCKEKDKCPYLFEIIKGDTIFKKTVTEFMKLPEVANDPWIPTGTASPSLPVTLNDSLYILFTTCKPHDCGDNVYILAYQLKENRLIGLHINLNGNNIPVNSPSNDEVSMMTALDDGKIGDSGEKLPIKYTIKSDSSKKAGTSSEKDKIINEIVNRCETRFGQYRPSVVKGCVDNDLESLLYLGDFLKKADEQQKKIIANCTVKMEDYGWSTVRGCVDNDIKAQAELDELKK